VHTSITRSLADHPDFFNPKISPDATAVVYIRPHRGVPNLWHYDLQKGQHTPLTNYDRRLRDFEWIGNRFIVYAASGAPRSSHIYAIDLFKQSIRDLTPYEDVRAELISTNNALGQAIIALNRNKFAIHDLYRIDVATGESHLILDNYGTFGNECTEEWLLDATFNLRLAVRPKLDGGKSILYCEYGSWRSIYELAAEDALLSNLVAYKESTDKVCLTSSRGRPTAALIELSTHDPMEHVLAENSQFDVSEVVINPNTHEPEVAVFETEFCQRQIVSPRVRTDFEFLERKWSGRIELTSRNHEDTIWLLRLSDVDTVPRYHIFDRRRRTLKHLRDERQELRGYTFARTEPFECIARDGVRLKGYITFPRTNAQKLPTVLMVHPYPGRWSRAVWQFNADAQWLATCGFMCVQVSHRGCWGYGPAFFKLGEREIGAKIQDDLSDTLMWLIDRGYSDADRIAVYGRSIGGYAALMAACRQDVPLRCVASALGLMDLRTAMSISSPYRHLENAHMRRMYGDLDKDSDFFWERSPLAHVAAISVPVFMAVGANDARAPLNEAHSIVQSLRQRSVPYELLIFEDEAHDISRSVNCLEFHERLEAFLHKFM
jgi:dipeptidyl aminopeptidase/acylaminoacyl peptidase